ncbi:hypothetical protein AB1Y20_022800 [Prymnesium parvum]|uniref:Uncharacterized protein n=1 Tax=Prymnesium parvum TaxID=97485 RepID=A0AB34JET9_PRYPA
MAEEADAEAWRHIEALRALHTKVSARGAVAMSAALGRLQSSYAAPSRAASCRHAAFASLRAAASCLSGCLSGCLSATARTPPARAARSAAACCAARHAAASRAVSRWRAAHPRQAVWCVDFPLGALSALVFYADVASDVLLARELAEAHETAWAALSVFFIAAPCLLAYGSIGAYVRRTHGHSPRLWLALALGFPFGIVLLDLVMFVELSSLLHELSDALPAVRALKLFLPSYRATRVLWELSLETVPQSVLQLHIYLSWRHADAGVAVPLLSTSLAFSLLNLVKCTVSLYLDARRAGVGLRAHLWQLVELGRGLPLHALKANSVDAWKCEVALRDSALRELCAALRSNRSVRLLDLSFTSLGPAGGEAIGRVLLANRTITSLNLSRNQLGGGALEWARALADGLAANAALHSLDLSANNIGPRSCALLADGLRLNAGLYSLDLSRNCLVGLNALGHGEWSDEGVAALAAALRHNASLRRLSLEENQLSAHWRRTIDALLAEPSARRQSSGKLHPPRRSSSRADGDAPPPPHLHHPRIVDVEGVEIPVQPQEALPPMPQGEEPPPVGSPSKPRTDRFKLSPTRRSAGPSYRAVADDADEDAKLGLRI